MASTLRVTPIEPFVQDYLAQHSSKINEYAQLLGVPAVAIAAAIAEEMRNVYTERPGEFGAPSTVFKNILDVTLDWNVANHYSHAEITADFLARQSDIINGISPGIIAKITSPTSND